RPEGINVGFNLGKASGGSVGDHLHMHVVPRWSGDSNFMTILDGTKVLPQLLKDTRQVLADGWQEIELEDQRMETSRWRTPVLSVPGRKPAAVFVEPVARTFLKIGLTPNAVTLIGTFVTIAITVTLIPSGHLFAAAVFSGIFAAFDMVDGTMARLSGGATKFGATLDASCDRITDGALFAAIIW